MNKLSNEKIQLFLKQSENISENISDAAISETWKIIKTYVDISKGEDKQNLIIIKTRLEKEKEKRKNKKLKEI